VKQYTPKLSPDIVTLPVPVRTAFGGSEKLAAGDGTATLPPIGGARLLHRAQAAVQKLAQAAKRP
jgi:hypothetical protein